MSKEVHELFSTTRWSLITKSKDPAKAAEALEALCKIYWYPVYSYVRLLGKDHHAAEDLTQSFFESFLKRGSFAKADPDRGRMRVFLTVAVKRYVIWSDRKDNRLKRGGNVVHLTIDTREAEHRFQREFRNDESPEIIFEKRWALALMEAVMGKLEREYAEKELPDLLSVLMPFLRDDPSEEKQHELAARFGMKPTAFSMKLLRMRQRHRELLQETVGDTLTNPTEDEVKSELRYLLRLVQAK